MPAGMSSAFDKPRMPYLRFEQGTIERRGEKGEVLFVTQNYVYVTQAGSVDTTQKIPEEWFKYLRKLTEDGQYPQGWCDDFETRYESWKKGVEIPLDGTPIKNWPVATPAEIKMLVGVNVLTVEDLAAANESVVARIGMGARALKQRAIDYIQAKKDTAPLVSELAAKQQQIDDQSVRIASLEAQVKELLVRSPAVAASVPREPLPDLETRLAARQEAVNNPRADADAVDDVLADL